MKRCLFNVLAALSLVLCVATVVAWVRSYWTLDDVKFARATFQCGLNSVRGGTSIGWWTFEFPDAQSLQRRRERRFDSWSYRSASLSGTSLTHIEYGVASSSFASPDGITQTTTFITFPHWSLAAVLILPTVTYWFGYRLRRARRQNGHCPACGYDLRASTERCPECGTAVPVNGEGATA
jgi:hypothetical protein